MTGFPERHPAALLDTGRRGHSDAIAVSPHHLASEAAVAIMSGGGNAVDAAVALNAVLGVVAPDTCGPGGDLFALVHRDGDEAPVALNASGRCGSGASAEALRRQGHLQIPERSPATITVPGCVGGWETLVRDRGTMTLADVLAPAIDLAEDGFPASLELSLSLERTQDLLSGQASAPPLYPDGRPPAPETTIRRQRFAATLRDLATGGAAAFYEGPVGRAITEVTNGVITAEDLSASDAEWVQPIKAEAFGRTGWTVPPNSQGYVALAAAAVFDRISDVGDPDEPAFQHGLIEAYRMFAAERDDAVADPLFATLDNDEILRPSRLMERARRFDPLSASAWATGRAHHGGTAFMCTRDGDGLSVSLIQSNFHGIGSGLSAGDTGVFLHDRGGGFNLIPGHPNELAPRKRPFHTLSPTLWTLPDGRLSAVIGTRGGEYQPQYIVQAAARLFRAGAEPVATQAAPRWQVDTTEGEEVVKVEPGFGQHMARALRRLGHDARLLDSFQPGWGPICLITSDENGVIGAADPRISTSAALAST